jgi:hypothetical protein
MELILIHLAAWSAQGIRLPVGTAQDLVLADVVSSLLPRSVRTCREPHAPNAPLAWRSSARSLSAPQSPLPPRRRAILNNLPM